MAVIKSGNSTDQWTVDPISKAGRITLYNPDGSLLTFPSGLTDSQLRANPIPVSGTFFPATQPVSIASMPSTPVTGTFFQATQPVSIASMPSTPVTGTFFQAVQPVSGAFFQATQPVSISGPVSESAADQVVTATGASGGQVTATLPAVVGQFHYITMIEIVKFNAAAITASGTPVLVVTVNLPGSLAWTVGNADGGIAVGTTFQKILMPTKPIKSSVANTATSIVCPATTGVIWRVNVFYQAAA